jgi:long-chain fatty acid transport protein
MKTSNKIMQICVAAAVAGWSAGAVASGFALIEQNASGMGNAYAGQAAAAENASTIFFNPAGMTRLPGKQISAGVSVIRPVAEFTNDGGSRSPSPFLPLGNNGGDAGDWNYIPSGYFSWQLTPKLWAGVGLTVPFGLGTDYDPNFIGRFQSQKVKLVTYDLNPSVAYQINDVVSVGGGVSFQHAKLNLDRSFSAVLAPLAQSVSLDDNAWGWNLGAMFNLGPQTRAGLAYRSAINYDLAGGVTLAAVGSATAKASLSMPDSLSAAISHQFTDKWQLLGDVTWTRWSKIQNVPLILTSRLGATPAGTVSDVLDLQFKDTYRVGLGANFRWTDNFMLKLGISYDKTPVPDALHRPTFLPDNNRTALAFGAKHQLSKAGTLDVGYTHLFLSDGGTLRNKDLPGVNAGEQGVLSGSYAVHVNMVSVQYTHAF